MKKSKLLLTTVFALIALIFLGNGVYAENTMTLNITDKRPYTNKEYTVTLSSGTDGINVDHTIFKIGKRNGAGPLSFEDSLYCLRSGIGFGNSAGVNNVSEVTDVVYTETYNLKTQATDVTNYYRNTIGYTTISPVEYNSILWIIDNMYLPEHKDAAEMKANLLKNAEIINSELTDDDIEFVQQMALWYFSNKDHNGEANSLSLIDSYVLSNATKIDGESLDPVHSMEVKATQIDTLYTYFKENAIAHANDYGTGDLRTIQHVKPTVNVKSDSKTVAKGDGFSVVGPFRITETQGNVDYKLTITVKDKNGTVIPEESEGTPIIFVVKNPSDMVPFKNSIKETIGEGEFYLKISDVIADLVGLDLTDLNIEANCEYGKIYSTTATLWVSDIADTQPVVKIVREEVKTFDLALRKYITKVNGVEIANTKVPNIDVSKIKENGTADYKHRKEPVEVKPGDKVTYTISVYNEGDIDGAVTKIIDYLPEGLEFDPADNPELIVYKEGGYNLEEIAGKKYEYKYDSTARKIEIIPIEDASMPETGLVPHIFSLEAFDGTTLDTESLEIVCKVTAAGGTSDTVLTNIATMEYEPLHPSDKAISDRDSSSNPSNLNLPTNSNDWSNYSGNDENKPYLGDSEYFYQGQEDDDDFDKVVIKGVPFDLSLRKFITKINGKEITTRIPKIDTSKLNTVDSVTGKKITTAIYTHQKDEVTVKQGDIVTYTIRVYNEGELDGYATEIADYLPEGLGYLMNYKTNTDNLWSPVIDTNTEIKNLVGEDGLYKSENSITNLKKEDFYETANLSDVKILVGSSKIKSTAMEDEIIKAYNYKTTSADITSADKWQKSENGTDGLYYREVEVTCIVIAENTFKDTLKNVAEISEDKAVDSEGNKIIAEDRDSQPGNVYDDGKHTPGSETNGYTPGEQDDDDFEPLVLRYFDLALRKFITAVNEEAVTTRIPKPTINSSGDITYIHDKTPVYVANSDIVTYTIRVYNEGTVLGYAMEVSDDIPDGVEFLPNNETNKKYKWEMLDANGKKTDDPTKAVEIRTKYLENSLLKPYDQTKAISEETPFNPDYAEVKVAFLVVEENITQEDRIITNKAQITEDKAVDEEGNEIDIDDEDSIPDKWNEGEDDQDVEHIYVKKFDLALLKWVTQTIVTVDGKTTTTDTGFTPYDAPEPIAKVVIDKKKLDKTTVKFVYNIIIMNQGEIEGYATEVTDYIPEGLEFAQEDNPIWEKTGENKITTRALEDTLLKPGDSTTIPVVFRWKNGSNNLGLKTNIAEISEDYNDYGSPDIDSTPDNVIIENYENQQEDDDDRALVILELKTGGIVKSYAWLGLVVLTILAGGIILIKKYVL